MLANPDRSINVFCYRKLIVLKKRPHKEDAHIGTKRLHIDHFPINPNRAQYHVI